MRLRRLAAAAALVLVATSLSACRTNVGLAAAIDGRSYSESDIGAFITPQAQPVPEQVSQTQTLDIPPRSFIVAELIRDRLNQRVVDRLRGKPFTAGEYAIQQSRFLNGKSPAQFAQLSGVIGYSNAFETILVRERVYNNLLSTAQSEAQQQNVQLNLYAVAQAINLNVRVNLRYGSWDPTKFSFDSGTGATLPDYLKIKSTLDSTTPATASTQSK